jgi:hypothetical protein
MSAFKLIITLLQKAAWIAGVIWQARLQSTVQIMAFVIVSPMSMAISVICVIQASITLMMVIMKAVSLVLALTGHLAAHQLLDILKVW